jgi:hypothetical protein
MDMLRDLVEIEYPLGNELVRSDTEVSFTFPDLSSELRAPLVDGLQEAVGQLVGTGAQPRLTVDRCPSHRVCREVGGRDSA